MKLDADTVLKMYAKNPNWEAIARHFRVSTDKVRGTVEPGYRARRAAQVSASRKRRATAPASRSRPAASDPWGTTEVPDDTRDFTARLAGDPLPGRSALDRRG